MVPVVKTAAELVAELVIDPSVLTDDPETVDVRISDQFLRERQPEVYLGSHQCFRASEFARRIELWAFPDGTDPYWAGWELLDDYKDIGIFIDYCPYCGLDLNAVLKPTD